MSSTRRKSPRPWRSSPGPCRPGPRRQRVLTPGLSRVCAHRRAGRDNAVMGRLWSAGVLVGRSSELSVLRAAWASAVDWHPCWVFVGGEAGIGKTRLVAEFAHEAAAHGARVVVGNCPPVAPGLVPFAPVLEVLRELGPSTAEGLAGGHAEAIARLLEVELPVGHSGIPG